MRITAEMGGTGTGNRLAELRRRIGSCDTGTPGASVVILGGVHGNEPAGVAAQRRVFELIRRHRLAIRGRIMGLCANRSALKEGVRYIDEDLNRIWLPGLISGLRESGEAPTSERREMRGLMKEINRFTAGGRGSLKIMIDLHSFSGEGPMFAITAPRPLHLRLLEGSGIPIIHGIEKTLQGTTLQYYQNEGFVTVAFEGGQHRNPMTVENMVAGLLMMLHRAGVIDISDLPEGIEPYRDHIRQQTAHVPRRVELVYQHMLQPGDRFRMKAGYRNFQPIRKGEVLASDKEGIIEAQYDGFILMPLYQNRGDDGFFIVRQQK